MSVTELLERLKRGKPGEPSDWRATREEIHDLHEASTSWEERDVLLAIFKAVMDNVERQLPESEVDAFREIRSKDRNVLLVREALIGENVSVELLDAVTKREVLAGRMDHDDHLRGVAVKGLSEPFMTIAELTEQHLAKTRPAPPRNGWRRFFG